MNRRLLLLLAIVALAAPTLILGAQQQPAPQPHARQNPALYRTAFPNPQGTFTIAAVPPGPYKLFAWESLPQTAHQNADFMKTYEDRGVSIVVQANTTISPTVAVIPADRK